MIFYMGTDGETQKQTLHGKGVLETHSSKWSPSNPCPKSSENPGEQKEYMTQRGWRTAKREVL